VTKKITIATLCCCFNRVHKTSAFFESLIQQVVSENYSLDYYMLDDNSPDETGRIIKEQFPIVNVTMGSGSLFWAGGMRTLWKKVLDEKKYDLFLLLNDDVVLVPGAVERLLKAFNDLPQDGNIVLGTVLDPQSRTITYGGHRIKNYLSGSIFVQEPDEQELMPCEIGNANILLVDKFTVNKLGILSDLYTHGLADFDYTYTAVKNGLGVWVAPGFYGYCENDHGVSWLPSKVSLRKRIQHLYSPKGLAYKEYMTFVRRHFPLMLPAGFFKAWLKTLFPVVYDLFKKT
jgi:GT2 family glycosyltransferase